MVVAFQDISERQRPGADEGRVRFHRSHELRTPISAACAPRSASLPPVRLIRGR